MKKNIFLMLAVLISLMLLTACNSKKEFYGDWYFYLTPEDFEQDDYHMFLRIDSKSVEVFMPSDNEWDDEPKSEIKYTYKIYEKDILIIEDIFEDGLYNYIAKINKDGNLMLSQYPSELDPKEAMKKYGVVLTSMKKE